MLSKVKMATRTVTTAYDDELLMLIDAAVRDLKSNTGCQFSVETTVNTSGVTTDYVVRDALAQVAICTYVRLHFGAPSDYERLKTSYDEQKAQLRMNSDYTEEQND